MSLLGKRTILGIFAAGAAVLAFAWVTSLPGTYDECVVYKSRGITHDEALQSVQRVCRERHPNDYGIELVYANVWQRIYGNLFR